MAKSNDYNGEGAQAPSPFRVLGASATIVMNGADCGETVIFLGGIGP